jgi:CubicO group peptidase (beta-lactamase class C family)
VEVTAVVKSVDRHDLESWVARLLNRRPAVGMALGIIRDGRLDFFHAHGLANIVSGRPVTEDTVFRIASISKTFTAIAVMQLVERGRVDLDAPANEYLRAFQLIPGRADHRPATVRHLMTHTSGVPEMIHASRALGYVYGESFRLGERVPSLGEYYGGGIRLAAQPGTRFTYSDHNFSTLGQIVEDVSGEPLDRYLREHVFAPLGMADTDLDRTEQVESRLATGYSLGRHGPTAVTDRQWLTAAASMVYSSPRDMARYLAALLAGGANDHGSILRPQTLATMFEPQYQPDPRIPGIGLAFDRGDFGGHRAIFHEGILPGFNSQIFVAPDDNVGVMAFTNGARMAMLWLPAETGRLLSHVLDVPDATIRTDVPQHPEVWSELCGRYPLEAPLTDMRTRAMLGLGGRVFVRSGQLMVRVLTPVPAGYRGFVLHPDDEADPYVFRIDLSELGIGSGRIVFTPDRERGRTRLSFDLFPVSLRRRPATGRRRWLAGGALGLAAAGTAAVIARRRP